MCADGLGNSETDVVGYKRMSIGGPKRSMVVGYAKMWQRLNGWLLAAVGVVVLLR